METGEPEVSEELSRVDRCQRVHALELQNDLSFHDNVEAVSDVESNALVHDWKRNLLLCGNPGMSELPEETFLVRRLQQPRTEMPMHLDRRPEYSIGDFVRYCHSAMTRAKMKC